jgi:hypothetical protein
MDSCAKPTIRDVEDRISSRHHGRDSGLNYIKVVLHLLQLTENHIRVKLGGFGLRRGIRVQLALGT